MLTSEFQLIDNEGNVRAKKQVLGHLQGNTRRKAYIPKRQLILLSEPTVKGTFQHMGISLENTAAMIAMSWIVFGRMAI